MIFTTIKFFQLYPLHRCFFLKVEPVFRVGVHVGEHRAGELELYPCMRVLISPS